VELAGPLLFVVATLPPFKRVERTVKKSLKENHSNKPFSTDHLHTHASSAIAKSFPAPSFVSPAPGGACPLLGSQDGTGP